MTCLKRYFINNAILNEESNKKPDIKLWKAKITEYVQMIRREIPPLPKNADGGLYVGTAGIAYLFYCLIKSPLTASQKKEYASQGIEYICTAERYFMKQDVTNPTDHFGFLLGKAGFHAVAAVLYTVAGNFLPVNNTRKKLIN